MVSSPSATPSPAVQGYAASQDQVGHPARFEEHIRGGSNHSPYPHACVHQISALILVKAACLGQGFLGHAFYGLS